MGSLPESVESYDRSLRSDVLIVGSGPVGATYARKLVDAGIKVLMVEMGDQERPIPGDHKKNSVQAQKDLNKFIDIVLGDLELLSIPVDKAPQSDLDSTSWSTNRNIRNGQNPDQDAFDNLPVAAATRTVGGMGAHWTCCTPEQHPELERSDLFSDEEWKKLYAEAKTLVKTNNTSFDNSIRQQLVLKVLQGAYKGEDRKFQPLPLACERRKTGNTDYVEWSSSATIFGDITSSENDLFTLLSSHQCEKLVVDEVTGKIKGALVKDLLADEHIFVQAKRYVVCAGATLTPGILFNSGFTAEEYSLPALGHYLTEPVMSFCQVVLDRNLVEAIKDDPWQLGWNKTVMRHEQNWPEDPVPLPFNDPDPQVWMPVTEDRPWHAQIHRDAFYYGQTPAEIDQRLVVDFRFYSAVKPVYENYVDFSKTIKDGYGMPQPTFHYQIPKKDAEIADRMMNDMVDVASNLGGWLPGSEPRYLPPGSALHICGTTRAGTSVNDSVVDRESRVWGHGNLFLGGCSVIPTQTASNPTLTAIGFAIVGANAIVKELKK
ncbi:hypothetical protein BFW01_g11110 [Lasiodiplodia theobromae]|nr:hypothetical protein BFW01_g11110 [Lasiodiplodia theobromae]